MTTTKWKTSRTLPYAGYTLANHDFGWNYVERIGEIQIHEDTLQAEFTVYFTSGSNLRYSYSCYRLVPDYTATTSLFGIKRKKQITDIQYYFDRNCEKLQLITTERNKVVTAYSRYLRGTIHLQNI